MKSNHGPYLQQVCNLVGLFLWKLGNSQTKQWSTH